ncbi:MAG: hypothetical protein IKN72_06235 [Clostridia bacterium]|nr:hypothetical protein [Clostridia bacterium]
MTKQKQIETLCEIIDRLDSENRQLKREKKMINAELQNARKNAMFWQEQALRLMNQSEAVQEIRMIFGAGTVRTVQKEKKKKLFTMD